MKNQPIFLILFITLYSMSACNRTKDYFEEAMQAYEQDNLPAALAGLQIAIAQDSTNRLYWLKQAHIKREMGDYEGALNDYKAIQYAYNDRHSYLDDEDREFYYGIAMTYFHLNDIENFFSHYCSYVQEDWRSRGIDLYTRPFAVWEVPLPQTPEDYYWYGVYYEKKEEYPFAYFHFEQAAQHGFSDALEHFRQVARQLNRPDVLLEETTGKITEITFMDGSTLLLDQQLDHNTSVEDYELISIEKKSLSMDYLFCYSIEYHFSDIMSSLIQKHPPFNGKKYFRLSSNYAEIAWEGKKIGFNLSYSYGYNNHLGEGRADVLVYRFNTAQGEKNFLIGLGIPESLF